jgi:membrane associated rhomboid family serine protease
MRLSGRKRSFYTPRLAERQRLVLPILVGANAAFFIAQLIVDFYQPGFVRDYLGISNRGVSDAYAWQFPAAMLLHAGPWHFIGNMLLLYLLGRDLESILGRRHFLYLYLSGAVAGELGHLFLMPADSILFAASGGVAAIVFAYATILPELELIPGTFFRLRLKAKHLAYGSIALAVVLVCINRTGQVAHSACLGGCAAGWFYAHLLGFGRPSFLQRFLQQQREETRRYNRMSIEQLISDEIDPLLEKIARCGLANLTRREHRNLLRARAKILEKTQSSSAGLSGCR